MRILVAGASGVVGRNLLPLLVRDGHEVTGTTRSAAKASGIEALGAKAAIMDAFDAQAVERAVAAARPEVVVHQLTDLPQTFEPAKQADMAEANARLRIEGTRNLVHAAKAAGVKRVVAQSIAWIYAPGDEPHYEADPLDAQATGPQLRALEGVISLEHWVVGTPEIEGVVLRYGRLYGPGTWTQQPNGRGPLHVEAAARAAALAVTRGAPGIYNIAEEDGYLRIDKAKAELGFDPAARVTA